LSPSFFTAFRHSETVSTALSSEIDATMPLTSGALEEMFGAGASGLGSNTGARAFRAQCLLIWRGLSFALRPLAFPAIPPAQQTPTNSI
jgi:hypothetical protein